jgi:hypothetical protein
MLCEKNVEMKRSLARGNMRGVAWHAQPRQNTSHMTTFFLPLQVVLNDDLQDLFAFFNLSP